MNTWRDSLGRLTDRATKNRFGYTGRLRSGLREADRVVRATAHPGCRPSAVLVRTFWWEKVSNFGDQLTPHLLRHSGIVPLLTPPGEADLIGVGSLIQHLPESYAGTLWGSGLVSDERRELPEATHLALRGEWTRDRMGSPSVMALGDPGLLISGHVRRQAITHDVGLVPHYVHADDERLAQLVAGHPGRVKVVDVQQSPLAVAREIASCRSIVSTSLHGVITADSFGIPATWIRMPKALAGGDFKFGDHETVVRPASARGVGLADVESLAELVARAQSADADAVARSCEALLRAARAIPETTPHRTVPTWQVPVHGRGGTVHQHI